MKRVLLAATFDPPTLGHLDLIERASKLCDHLILAVGSKEEKKGKVLFSTEERIAMLRAITGNLSHLEIVHFDGLVVDCAKAHRATCLVRGLRAFSDFDEEFRMALANRKISGLETIFLMADAQYAHISSSLIREIGRHAPHLHDFLPKPIEAQVLLRLKQI